MSVQIPQFTEDLNIISSLADQPTMTSSELKAEFDLAGNKIKDYINNILISGIQDAIDEMEQIGITLDSKITEKLQAIYHVGKEIVTSVDVNPATYLGFGTWELVGKGKVEIGVDHNNANFNTVGKTGGTFSKTLSANNIPQLNSNKRVMTGLTQNINNSADLTLPQGGSVIVGLFDTKETITVGSANPTAVDITPSFETVYKYRRTA